MCGEKRLFLLNPRGFCAGVCRAIGKLEDALKAGGTIYVLHELVHNEHVIESFRARGVVFVADVTDVPVGATLVLSAHGVPVSVENACRSRGLTVIDATCPLVKQVHSQLTNFYARGVHVFLIGHPHHTEVVGTLGRVDSGVECLGAVADVATLPPRATPVAYLTQTTLSSDEIDPIVAALKAKFPQIEGTGNVCYATQNRQGAVRALAGACDALIVVGSAKSSNSQRLREVGEHALGRAYLISDERDLTPSMFEGVRSLALTSGASTPESLFQSVRAQCVARGYSDVQVIGTQENFKL